MRWEASLMANKRLKDATKSMVSSVSPILLSKILFVRSFKKWPNFSNPKSFNEKIHYLKFNDYYNNPLISRCVDKYEVRNYLGEIGMQELCPKLYGVYKSADEIVWDQLPNQFVLKCNHGSGMNILCSDKSNLDENYVLNQVQGWLNQDYWKLFSEVHYKNVEKRVIVEELLDENIQTYKFFCFHGKIKCIYVSLNGENGEKEKYQDFFDCDWNSLPITSVGYEQSNVKPEKPQAFEKNVQNIGNIVKRFSICKSGFIL